MYILSFIANIFKTATGSLWRFCHPDLVKKVLDTALVRAPCTARNGYAMNKKPKSIPKFRSEAEERRFWETHDSGDFVELDQGRAAALSKPQAVNDCDLAAPTSDAS